MALNQDKDDLCTEILLALEKISHLLMAQGRDPEAYKWFKKIKNIARSRDPGGIPNIDYYLASECRMLFDNRLLHSELEHQVNVISAAAKALNLNESYAPKK